MPPKNDFVKIVRERLGEMGLTPTELARRVGCVRQTPHNFLKRRNSLNHTVLEKVFNELGLIVVRDSDRRM